MATFAPSLHCCEWVANWQPATGIYANVSRIKKNAEKCVKAQKQTFHSADPHSTHFAAEWMYSHRRSPASLHMFPPGEASQQDIVCLTSGQTSC